MTIPDFSIELINKQTKLSRLIDRLASLPVIALDIETINWWNRHQERLAIIQIAFRGEKQPKVVIIDALANLDLEPRRLLSSFPILPPQILYSAVLAR